MNGKFNDKSIADENKLKQYHCFVHLSKTIYFVYH
jgi:hypothetical protein